MAEILVTRMTCRRKRALQAVLTALTRGESPEYVERQLIQWANWLAVDANHNGLRAPGMFVAAKLADAEPRPHRCVHLLGRQEPLRGAQPDPGR